MRPLLLAALLLPAGCGFAPRVDVIEPTSVRPAPARALAASSTSGSIYQASSYRPLFEDRRARHVGDTLTVLISEKVSASQKSSTSVSRTGSVAASIPTFSTPLLDRVPVLNGIDAAVRGTDIAGSGTTKSDGKGEAASSNVFTGTLTVTVVEVLANGHLVVSGEKQIGTNREKESLRFSGVVNPVSILAGNSVSSAQIADARLDYRGEGAIDSATMTGWLSRFFLSVLPF